MRYQGQILLKCNEENLYYNVDSNYLIKYRKIVVPAERGLLFLPIRSSFD